MTLAEAAVTAIKNSMPMDCKPGSVWNLFGIKVQNKDAAMNPIMLPRTPTLLPYRRRCAGVSAQVAPL